MSIASSFLNKDTTGKSILLWATLNGWSMYILSYLGVYLIAQIATGLVSELAFGINASLHFSGLEFLLHGKSWSPESVVPVFLTSPAVAFILGCFCLRALLKLETTGTIWKQFFFWGFLHGVNLSLGAIISGTVAKDGIWFSLKWSSLPEPLIFALAGFCILLLVVIGYLASVLVFMSCDSLTLMKEGNRSLLLNAMLLFPWILGNAFVFLLKFPVANYDLGLGCSFVLLVIPMYVRGKSMLVNDLVNSPKRTIVAWEVVMAAVILSILVKILL
ncbi:hypothetical protein [Rufibacter roseolus]|uniref:hypothetical protein n=1 Tax=Rufibacter roseolus TaxID=2817375 RepID=UPI001B3160E3|nr:hypothetical protein [Rufibacter roseolus]